MVTREAPLRKLDWFPQDGLDDGIYGEAAKQGKTVSMWLEDLRAEKRGTPGYAGMTKEAVLRAKAAAVSAGREPELTAFEECLKAAGIRAFGANSDIVAKFFEYADTDVLFPEFWADRIYAGMLADSLVPEFCMPEIVVDALNFHKLYIEDTEADRQLASVAAGEELPETKIGLAEQAITLRKYGRYLTVTYEEIKYQRLSIFGAVLQRIGKQIDIDRTDTMFYTLVNGDGASGACTNVEAPASAGSISVADVIEWATVLPAPYKLNKFAARKLVLRTYYATLATFSNPAATWGFVGIDLPKAYEWNRAIITTDYMIGVDSRYAIQHVTTGPVLTETEKIIRKQVNGTAVTHRDGFAVTDMNAVAIYDTGIST